MPEKSTTEVDVLSDVHDRAKKLQLTMQRHEAELAAMPGGDAVIGAGLAAVRRVIACAQRVVTDIEDQSGDVQMHVIPPLSMDMLTEDHRDG